MTFFFLKRHCRVKFGTIFLRAVAVTYGMFQAGDTERFLSVCRVLGFNPRLAEFKFLESLYIWGLKNHT